MARISYVSPDDATDPEVKAILERSIERGGGETNAVRAHSPVIAKYFANFTKDLREEGTVDAEMQELIRARVATSWESMFSLEDEGFGCHY